MAGTDKQEDITVILTSPKVVKYHQILPVKKYNLALVQDFPELVNIIETEVFTEPFQYINFLHKCLDLFCQQEKKVVLLLDICFFTELFNEFTELLLNLVTLDNAYQVIISLSSGVGSQIDPRSGNKVLHETLKHVLHSSCAKLVHLEHFTREQATWLLKHDKVKFNIEDLESYCSFNTFYNVIYLVV